MKWASYSFSSLTEETRSLKVILGNVGKKQGKGRRKEEASQDTSQEEASPDTSQEEASQEYK